MVAINNKLNVTPNMKINKNFILFTTFMDHLQTSREFLGWLSILFWPLPVNKKKSRNRIESVSYERAAHFYFPIRHPMTSQWYHKRLKPLYCNKNIIVLVKSLPFGSLSSCLFLFFDFFGCCWVLFFFTKLVMFEFVSDWVFMKNSDWLTEKWPRTSTAPEFENSSQTVIIKIKYTSYGNHGRGTWHINTTMTSQWK